MIGKTILHYKILEKLGEGGMGIVYLADDSKLKRQVAIKFLPKHIAANTDERKRFEIEAQAAAALNHPNIATIHAIEESDDQMFIVMEYITGVTLGDYSQKMSEKKILDIGIQIAEGLGAAHEKGIVHRDIKPDNIMIRKDGIVQIMDFGLAKLYASGDASRLTKAGTTIGTVKYMSPEQVQGMDTDYRTDIFSLGVVLYELLVGEPPFKGMHESAIMYETVNVDPPPISSVKEGVDPLLEEIVLECLEKDKDDRCQSAKEFARNLRKLKKGSSATRRSRVYNVNPQALEAKAQQTSSVTSSTTTTLRDIPVKNFFKSIFYNPAIFWSAAAIFFFATVLLLIFFVLNKQEKEIHEIKAAILPTPGITFANDIGSNISISPNGKYIAYVGSDSSDVQKLWLRPVNSLIARALADASLSAYPFWSPDSRFIAYFHNRKLMKLSIEAGTSLPICDAQSGRGGTWSKNGTIVFAPKSTGSLYKVSSAGGEPDLLVQADTTNKYLSFRWPFFLPDGEHFLYSTESSSTGSTAEDGIFLASLNKSKGNKIINTPSNAQYANGYVFYVNQSILLAQKFDPGNFELSGEEIPLAENLQFYDVRVCGTFSVSENGTIIYQEQNLSSDKAVLLDKGGDIIKALFEKNIYQIGTFSPDGNRIAFDSYDRSEKNIDIWTFDINRNVLTRLTFEQTADRIPTWTPDGKQIAFSSNPNQGIYDSYIKNSDGSGQTEVLYKSENTKLVTDFSQDGNHILYTVAGFGGQNSRGDIVILPRSGDGKPIEFIASDFNEWFGSFSPNGKWVAYHSDESGKDQVYVVPFEQSRGKWQISVDGGLGPKWMDSGKKVYFFTSDNKIMGVDINESESSISPGQPYPIFKPGNINISEVFDIDKNGNKILATIPTGESIESPITLITNWQQGIEGKK